MLNIQLINLISILNLVQDLKCDFNKDFCKWKFIKNEQSHSVWSIKEYNYRKMSADGPLNGPIYNERS